MTQKDSFKSENLDQQVNWINELLQKRLENDLPAKDYLGAYLSREEGVKSFCLQQWSNGETNPTLEIVLVDGAMKLGITRYGVLSPLGSGDCNQQAIKEELIAFIIDPMSYLKKRAAILDSLRKI